MCARSTADWHRGADIAALRAMLAADTGHAIKAICAVHNETATGMVLPLAEIRAALDAAGHPALLLVDTISSLGSMEFRMDDWGVDVAVGGSQKGLMLPTGLSFTGVSAKAMAAHARPACRNPTSTGPTCSRAGTNPSSGRCRPRCSTACRNRCA